MPRDRDQRKDYHTPPGVIAPVVPSSGAPESWDGARAPVTAVVARPPGGESIVEAIARRTGETKNVAISTLDRVDALRREIRDDNGKVNERVDDLYTIVANLRADMVSQLGTANGQNVAILQALGEQNKVRDRLMDQQAEERRAMLERESKARELSGMLKLKEFELEQQIRLQDAKTENADHLAVIEDRQAAALMKRTIVNSTVRKILGWATSIVAAAIAGGYIFKHC